MHVPEINSWPRSLRWVHLGIAVLVTYQLASRTPYIMRWDMPFFLHSHLYTGLAASLFIAAFWILAFRTPGMLRHLFPYSKSGMSVIRQDIRTLLSFRYPETGMRGGLSGAFEGLGIVAITVMAISGICMFVLIQEGEPFSVFSHSWTALVHIAVSKIVWAYWFGHVGMAILHGIRKPGIFQVFLP